MRFDLVLTNPPFQDSLKRNKTPHKLWIEFTQVAMEHLLKDGGTLCQVSPASFGSPSNAVLDLMRRYQTLVLRFDTEGHFAQTALKPGSTFSDYAIRKLATEDTLTEVKSRSEDFTIQLDEKVWYLPNDICTTSMEIHRKVIFEGTDPLPVEWDYVTCHNINRFAERSKTKEVTLSETARSGFPFEIYHTSRSSWWSSIEPPCLKVPKVVWSRSGYMKPVADEGRYGVTDMAYFVRVRNLEEAETLAANLSLKLIQYITKSAKWSGFGNERVFSSLPNLPRDHTMTDDELFQMFSLTREEVNYIEEALAPKRRRSAGKS